MYTYCLHGYMCSQPLSPFTLVCSSPVLDVSLLRATKLQLPQFWSSWYGPVGWSSVPPPPSWQCSFNSEIVGSVDTSFSSCTKSDKMQVLLSSSIRKQRRMCLSSFQAMILPSLYLSVTDTGWYRILFQNSADDPRIYFHSFWFKKSFLQFLQVWDPQGEVTLHSLSPQKMWFGGFTADQIGEITGKLDLFSSNLRSVPAGIVTRVIFRWTPGRCIILTKIQLLIIIPSFVVSLSSNY